MAVATQCEAVESRGWRRGRRYFPSLQRARDRMGPSRVCQWVSGVSQPRSPPFSFIALCDRGLPTRSQLSAPDQDAVEGSDSIVGSSQMRSILTFSPLISSYTLSLVLNLKYLTWHPFHYRLVYKACLVIIVSTIRLTCYNTSFYFETYLLLILGP